ncbi:MAG: hypothetical protein SFU99_16170 [Saprospiraceae bacterium]|nr:hypothetical protein [Saprospiraceae bacterium]
MNSRLEAQRASQNRAIALFLTFLFHVALIAGIYYYNFSDTSDVKPNEAEQTLQSKEDIPTKTVSDKNNRTLKP